MNKYQIEKIKGCKNITKLIKVFTNGRHGSVMNIFFHSQMPLDTTKKIIQN